MKHGHWLIIYDICEPKRLQKVGKIVSRFGERVQKSVFETDINDIMINALQKQLEAVIEEHDFIAIIPLYEKDWQKSEKYGIIAVSNYTGDTYAIL